MKSGQPYLVELDLLYRGGPRWPYEEEEFTFIFLLDGAPHITATALGDSSVALHGPDGTYGPARFVVIADEQPGDTFLWLSLLTRRGLLARTDKLPVTIQRSGQDARDESPVLEDFARRVLARTSEPAVLHYLIVQLMPDARRPDYYLTTVWSEQPGDYPVTLLADDVSQSIQEVPRKLGPVLEALRTRLPRTQLSVEFILPDRLLEEPVDEWVVNSRPLGIDHPVVVRSLERMRYPSEHRVRVMWRSKWQQLRQAEHGSAQLALISSREQLEQVRVAPDLYPCLFLDFTPGMTQLDVASRIPRGAEGGIVTQFVKAGVPAILWPRRNHSHHVEQVYSLVRTAGIDVLPSAVHELRRERADTYSNGHGPKLSLLWDDPERVPG